MLKSETESRSAFVAAGPSGSVADGQAAGSAWRGPTPVQGHIGFIGLGHMCTAIAANLAAAGRQVIAYVRRAEQMGKLAALGLKPTTDITEVYDREFVISMLPDDASVPRGRIRPPGSRRRRACQVLDPWCHPSVDEHYQHLGFV